SHLETFDPKPEAPREVRGDFDSIATVIPGVRFGQHLPELGRRVDRLCLVRSMTTTSPVHELAVHRLLGGVTEPPSGTGVAATRTARPPRGPLRAAAPPPARGTPPSVILPTRLTFGGTTSRGQNAGFLGAQYYPGPRVGDPSDPRFASPALDLPAEIALARSQ